MKEIRLLKVLVFRFFSHWEVRVIKLCFKKITGEDVWSGEILDIKKDCDMKGLGLSVSLRIHVGTLISEGI